MSLPIIARLTFQNCFSNLVWGHATQVKLYHLYK